MANKFLLRSFAGGEISPELAGRLDLVKWQTGLSLCRNFITLPHGPAARRPGFEFIRAAGDSTHEVRLIPFAFSATQTAVLEFGHQYIRFHIDGATLMGGGSPYQVTTPYQGADLFDLHYTQSADIITITHPSYAARELARNSATDWTLSTISFGPPSDVPTNIGATATIANNTNLSPQVYVVTAVQGDGVTESLASAKATLSNNLTLAGNFNTITWTGVSGASRYNVYKLRGGIFGYIGQTTPVVGSTVAISSAVRGSVGVQSKVVTVNTAAAHGRSTGDYVLVSGTGIASFDGYWQITVDDADTFHYTSAKKTSLTTTSSGSVSVPSLSLVDDNVLADTTQSPPEDIIALNDEANDYPGTTVYHEQRRWFAGTNTKPQVLWATRTGTDSNLTSSVPARADDAMELRIASGQYNQVRHLVALADLIAFTAGGEFRIYSENAPAITPTSVTIKPQGYSGASNVQPVVTSGSVLYVQAQGSHLRELTYSGDLSASVKTTDASIMAPHRFNGYTIRDLAFSRAPDAIAWAVRNDGVLLGMTYVPDQQVYGWHAHDTDGLFESVCVVPEGNEDVLYAVVRRTIGGVQLRYVERLRTRLFTDQEDAFYVDSGLTYGGTPVTSLSGLSHLNGKVVDILTDGAVHPQRTVSGGAITLDYAASVVHVGLPMTSDLRTLPLAMEGAQAAGQGTIKNVSKVHLRVSQSSIVKAGPDFTHLREYPARAVTDPYGSPPALRDGELSLQVDPSWNTDGAVCVRQDLPLPLTVLSMTLEVQGGG